MTITMTNDLIKDFALDGGVIRTNLSRMTITELKRWQKVIFKGFLADRREFPGTDEAFAALMLKTRTRNHLTLKYLLSSGRFPNVQFIPTP